MKNFKVISWNINSIRTRLPTFLDYCKKNDPDIILLQELKCEDHNFPYEVFESLPYNLALNGQKAYNGVAILSKSPIDEVKRTFTGDPDPTQARFIEAMLQTAMGYVKFISVYVPNGGTPGSDKFNYKLLFLARLKEYLNKLFTFKESVIIGGDFNVAPYDIDVYNPSYLKESTCFTLEERKRMRAILNLGFEDTYRFINKNTSEFSWWDYRGNSFNTNKGMRIDSVLTSPAALEKLSNSYIDLEVRGLEKASDHAPVIAEFKAYDENKLLTEPGL